MPEPRSRLAPMAVMVLALLTEGDMHPYEMGRLLRLRRDERLVKITNGTLYHSVGRLLELGLIVEVGIDRAGNRPERTTYTIAEPGLGVLVDWVRAELPRIDRPAPFRVALAEAHNLDREEALELLRIRRAALAADLEDHRAGLEDAYGDGVPAQFVLEVERQKALIAADLQWMDALLARLESDAIPWGRKESDAHTDRYRAQRKAAQQ